MFSLSAPRHPVARLLRVAAVLAALLSAVALAGVPLAVVTATPALAGGDPLAGRTVVGQVVQAWPESAGEEAEGSEEPLTWVRPAQGRPVAVSTEALAGVPVGSTVSVTVGGTMDRAAAHGRAFEKPRAVLGGEVLAAAPAAPATPAAATGVPAAGAVATGATAAGAVAPGTSSAAPATNLVTVVVVAPAGQAAQSSVDRVVSAVRGPVRDFWLEQSHGTVSVDVAATDVWAPAAIGCLEPTEVWAQAAAHARFTPGPGKHLLVAVGDGRADLADCAYGLAEVGSGPSSGGNLYVRDVLPSLVAHELGHNFGLGHSSANQCDAAVDTGSCHVGAYRDFYDVMGASWEQMGSLNAAQAAHLGVLPAAQVRALDPAAGATVTLAPLSAAAGIRAARLTAPGGVEYWLEYRPASGRDAWLATSANRLGLQTGVLLHRSGALPDTSLLLDGTPSARGRQDADLQVALPVGVPVAVSGGIVVTVAGAVPTGAAVTVTLSDRSGPAAAVVPRAAVPATGVLGEGPAAPSCCASPAAPGKAPLPREPQGTPVAPAPHPAASPADRSSTAPDQASAAAPGAQAAGAPALQPAAPRDASPAPASPTTASSITGAPAPRVLGAALGVLALPAGLLVSLRAARRRAAGPARPTGTAGEQRRS